MQIKNRLIGPEPENVYPTASFIGSLETGTAGHRWPLTHQPLAALGFIATMF